MGKLVATPALLALIIGARAAKWLLIAEGVTLFVIILWLTASCFGDKGFETVALIAALKWIIYLLPMAALAAIGIGIGWGLRKVMGLPANGSAFQMTRKP